MEEEASVYFHEVLYKIRSLNWKSERAVCEYLADRKSFPQHASWAAEVQRCVCVCVHSVHVCKYLFIGLTVRE